MSVNTFSGSELASSILSMLRAQPAQKRFLAGIVVEHDAPSYAFQERKKKAAELVGVDYRIYTVPADITNDALRAKIRTVAQHRTCGGVIVQLPLPEQVNAQYVMNVIPVEKDVDVLSERALGAFQGGRGRVLPPAVGTMLAIVGHYGLDLSVLNVAVVGPGRLVGKPIASYLTGRTRWLTVLDKGFDPAALSEADIIICGAGEATVDPRILKPGTGVIDFGYRSAATGPQGDLDTSDSAALDHLSFYTPTPGGTGPVLIAKLLENFYALNA